MYVCTIFSAKIFFELNKITHREYVVSKKKTKLISTYNVISVIDHINNNINTYNLL